MLEARAFNEWLANRRLQQEGETYADEIGRMTEAVNRRIPQLRYAPRRAPGRPPNGAGRGRGKKQ